MHIRLLQIRMLQVNIMLILHQHIIHLIMILTTVFYNHMKHSLYLKRKLFTMLEHHLHILGLHLLLWLMILGPLLLISTYHLILRT
ncbi:hypothetical protein KSF78_0002476 [Schistosoma japonicum]|nr:hypothetical protein KSF78_0002476 [Schistosoma japonicum]